LPLICVCVLKPLQHAVFRRLLEQAQRFRPYYADILGFYQEWMGKRVTAKQAQAALESRASTRPRWSGNPREECAS
jgi:hypothetical protein